MEYDIHSILHDAHQRGASDIHISVGAAPMMRLHGQLQAIGAATCMPSLTENMAQTLMTEEQWGQFVVRGELDFSYGIPGVSRFRINVYRQRGSVSLAIRTISQEVPPMEVLNLPPSVRSITEHHQGLFLVTGPTGSGKSTTIASMVDCINGRDAKHIITLEDPIEYLHPHKRSIVDQREIGSDTRTFADGLRASLRQDPDVILVGEMRDLETIATAIRAAETGHLVFATLHTLSAAQTVNRIIDVFPPNQQQQVRFQLASSLVGVVSQRLLPRADQKGRVAAYEVLINTPAIANLIRQEKVHQILSIMQTGRQQGMITMEQSIRELISYGIITQATAREYVPEIELYE